MRGGEKCLEAFLNIYPDADIYTLLHVPGATTKAIDERVCGTSFLQKIPGIQKLYRHLLFLYPLAIRSLHFRREYDLVISLSHAAAKNIVVPGNARHICYCFTPMRYIWDQAYQYFGQLTRLIWPGILFLRKWDVAGSKSVDHFIAISRFISARIRCYYRRDSTVIYPPVDTEYFEQEAPLVKEHGTYFLYAGALVPYKKVDLIIETFNDLGLPLIIAGDGPERERLQSLAGKSVTFKGRVSDEELKAYMAGCRALLFPGKEDFGIIPIECLATGRPVIAGFHGALRETLHGVKPWRKDERIQDPVGVFFRPVAKKTQLVEELKQSIRTFLKSEKDFTVEACQDHARKFSATTFRKMWDRFERDIVSASAPVSEEDVKTKAANI